MTRWIAILLVWALSGTALAQRQEPLFELKQDRIVRAVVTTTIDLPKLPTPPPRVRLPKMLLEAVGVLEVVDGQRLAEIRALAPRSAKPIGRPPDAHSVCFIHLIGSKVTKIIEVTATDDGLIVGEHAGTDQERPARAELNRVRWIRLSEGWSLFRGTLESTEDQLATAFDMPTPYRHGSFTFNFDTIEERFYHGQRLRNTYKLDRILNEDQISVRLPRGYDPSQPAGLLVWVSPTPRGTIPLNFWPALDEQNIIAIGAHNAGNQRMVNTRYQLAFDGIATASERYHVDPDRVYVTGMSGGGRVSSMLSVCFPDVFAGSLPIVGMNIYEVTRRGDGFRWQRSYYKPPVRLLRILRTRRMAPIGGEPDFNYAEMQAAIRVLKRDRIPVRFFEYDDMAHEMPKPDRFADAMRWVDEPYQEAQVKSRIKAEELLDEYATCFGLGVNGDGESPASDPNSLEALGLLLEVIEMAPWSPPAWSALKLIYK